MKPTLILLLFLCGAFAHAQEALPHTSLARYWKELKAGIPGKGTDGFIAPTNTQMREFETALAELVHGPASSGGLDARFQKLHYSFGSLTDSASGHKFLILADAGHKGEATIILNLDYTRNLVLEAPHPLHDSGTAEEGLAILEKAGARALFVSGAHRCADMETASGCTGTTSACGSDMPFRLSDAGHSVKSFFMVAHEVMMRQEPRPAAISLHGNAAEPVQAELSDGTTLPAHSGSLVIRFRNALHKNGVSVGSCNWAADTPSRLKLCGTTNVQGRLSNGVADACRETATRSTGSFLHLEQRKELRDNPDGLIQAIIDTFPPK